MSTREPLPERLPPPGSPNALFQSFRTGVALRELMRVAVSGTGVTGEQYALLGVVHFFPDRTPTELATTLGIPPTTVSRLVARLLRDGLVERVDNPEDGRSYLLRTTTRGAGAVETIAPRVRDLVRALEAALERPIPEIVEALVQLEQAAKSVLAEQKRVATDR